jgi:F-type H+-transporting ATPase subunit a
MGFLNTAYAAEGGISIHLAPDIIGHVFGVPITNTLLTVWLSMAVIAVLAFVIRARLAEIPGRLQTACEGLFGLAYDYMADVLESEKLARRFFPLIMTIFIFILFLNWIGLLPGVDAIGINTTTEDHGETALKFIPFFHPAATDLNITIAFALIAFFAIELSGIFLLGVWKYGGKFFNFSSPLNFFIGIIELFSELARLVSFAFRLFGNVFAGKTLLLVVMFFVPFVLPVPVLAFEVFVGFIQAFIFAILTLYFVKLAIAAPH